MCLFVVCLRGCLLARLRVCVLCCAAVCVVVWPPARLFVRLFARLFVDAFGWLVVCLCSCLFVNVFAFARGSVNCVSGVVVYAIV